MGQTLIGFLGLIVAIIFIRYRRIVGDMFGNAQWMLKVGGIHNIVIIVAILLTLWSLLMIFHLEEVFFIPLLAPFKLFMVKG
tara:strand:+ start:1249 stop:1494 length:246 start_codon:yes stop_codon:yes gene_type:complete